MRKAEDGITLDIENEGFALYPLTTIELGNVEGGGSALSGTPDNMIHDAILLHAERHAMNAIFTVEEQLKLKEKVIEVLKGWFNLSLREKDSTNYGHD